MPGSFKTEAMVLRSIRYGEADRVLHLYTADRGRVGAVAKGVRRVKSRLGGRLGAAQPGAAGAAPGPRRALHGQPGGHRARPRRPARAPRAARARRPGVRGGAAAARLHRAQPARLQPALQRAGAARRPARARHQGPGARLPPEAAAGRRLRARAGLLRVVRRDRAPGRLLAERGRRGLRRLRGRLVPARRRGARLPVQAIARPLAEAPDAAERALSQADRAIAETMEYHAHVRLRRVA